MIYREIIESLRAEKRLKDFVQPVPGGRQRVCFQYWYTPDTIDAFGQLAKQYPDHLDELLQIAAATLGNGWLVLQIAARLYGVDSYEALFEPLARAYTRAPKTLEGYGLSVPNFTRGMMDAMRHALSTRRDALDPHTIRALEQLVKTPPQAVRPQKYYRLNHTVFAELLAHRYRPDPRRIHTIADAIDDWGDFINDDDVNEMLILAPNDTALLPLVNRLVESSPRRWKQRAAIFYLSAFARTPDAWEPNDAEAVWTKTNLYPAVREPLSELFTQRAFTSDAVDAVFQSLVEHMTDETISAWFSEALNDLFKSSDLSRNLIRGFTVRMPDKDKHYVHLAVQSISTDSRGWEKIADWIAGELTEHDRKVIDLIPQRVRRATQWALAQELDKSLEERKDWMGRAARRLLTAALGMEPETTLVISSDDAIRYWQQVRLCLVDPQRLLEHGMVAPTSPTVSVLTGAEPITMRDYWRELDEARRAVLQKPLCQGR